MLQYIAEIQRQLVDVFGFEPRVDAPHIPQNVPDGVYPMIIDGKIDRVEIKHGKISCCNYMPTRNSLWRRETNNDRPRSAAKPTRN